ncbi:MAG: DUF4347 domain-containing protein, partial [Gammaproteobacteria bacterium]|nr:DUF4347 domain-containing protein [Gammaproteobacteria bacterium]
MKKRSTKKTAKPVKSSKLDSSSHDLMEELEARILMSDGIEAIILDPALTDAQTTPVIEASLVPGTADTTVVAMRHELVIVDTSVADYQKLLDDINANTDGDRQLDVVTIDSSKSGLDQISNILSQYQNLDAVHIISHGTDGQIFLGNSPLIASTLFANSDQIASWGNAFSADGDILFYGCNLAGSETGTALLQGLSNLTGTDVAASDDSTGHESLGADWDLEYTTGIVETSMAFSIEVQQNWVHEMATLTYLDQFNGTASTELHGTSGSDGTTTWSSSWVEVSSDDPGIFQDDGGNMVMFFTRGGTSCISTYERTLDLSAATSATFSLDFKEGTSFNYMDIFVYNGSTWTNVGRISGGDGSTSAYTTWSVDISAYTNAGSSIRIDYRESSGTGDDLWIDNLQVSYTTNNAPTVSNINGDALNYAPGDAATVIDQGTAAAVVDSDSANFDTGTLTVSFTAGSDAAEDVLAIKNYGTGAGQIGVSGSNVTYEGVTIGTFTGGSGGTNLVITFNSSSTPTAAGALI